METIIVDPKTGAQKGSKLARFDLIPVFPLKGLINFSKTAPDTIDIEKLKIEDLVLDIASYWNRESGPEILDKMAYQVIAFMAADDDNDTLSSAIWELAELYGKGCEKHGARNWEKGYSWSLSYAALMRHLFLHFKGVNRDVCEWDCKNPCKEHTGAKHLISVVWHCFALREYAHKNLGTDDRPGVGFKEELLENKISNEGLREWAESLGHHVEVYNAEREREQFIDNFVDTKGYYPLKEDLEAYDNRVVEKKAMDFTKMSKEELEYYFRSCIPEI